jgi:hypothetical protein
MLQGLSIRVCPSGFGINISGAGYLKKIGNSGWI